MKRILLIIIFVFLFFLTIDGREEQQNLNFKCIEYNGDQEQIHFYKIKKSAGGWEINLETKDQGNLIEQTFVVNDWADTRIWNYKNRNEDTRIKGEKKQGKVFLTGIHKGKNFKKSFRVGTLRWNQLFHIGLKDFIGSSEGSIIFFAIGTKGLGDMKGTKFKAKKKRENLY
jgi:hypothetical protein